MSNDNAEQQGRDDEMRAEYNFSAGVRGKHYKAYTNGFVVTVHKGDGTTEVRDFTLPPGAVVLEPDVRAYFPDSAAVNRALRGLIELLPHQANARDSS